MIFLNHFKILFSNESLDFCDDNEHLFSQPSLIIFTKGTHNSDHVCTCAFNYLFVYLIKRWQISAIVCELCTFFFKYGTVQW